MFKAIRKKPQLNQKINYKLQFKVTQIPPIGWEKLVVTVVSVLTGKNIWRSHESTVHDGNCEWSEFFIESIKLIQQLKSQGNDERLYKFVISKGESGSALGDVTLNLVEYARADIPLSVFLPLRNCPSGSTLHVKIQSLTANKPSRGMGWHTGNTIKQNNDLFGSDDEQGFSDLSGKSSTTSAESEFSQHSSGPLLMRSQSLRKDPKFTFQYSSDLSDEEQPSTAYEMSMIARKVFGDLPSFPGPNRSLKSVRQHAKDSSRELRKPFSPWIVKPISVDSNLKSATTTASQISQPSTGTVHGVAEIPEPLTAPQGDHVPEEQNSTEVITEDKSKEDLHGDRGLKLEIDILQQQLSEQLRQGADNDAKLLALFVERDKLKAEVERLKAERQSSLGEENVEADLKWEAEKAKQFIKELQEEVTYEKDKNMNLNIQLQKMQDSHVELVSEVEDLEKSLEEQRKTIEELLSKTQGSHSPKTVPRNEELDREKEWVRKFMDQEDKIHSLEISLLKFHEKEILERTLESETVSQLDSDHIIQSLKTEIVDLKKDSEELTKENTDLIFKLNAIKSELALKNKSADHVELKATGSPEASSELNFEEVSGLRILVNNLEQKLQENRELHELQISSNERLLVDLRASLEELRSENAYLDNELKCSEARASSLQKDLEVAKSEYAMLKHQFNAIAPQNGEGPWMSQIEGLQLHLSRNALQDKGMGQPNTGNNNGHLIYADQQTEWLSKRISELEEELRNVVEQRDAYRLERVKYVLEEESHEYHSKMQELEAKRKELMEECLAHKEAREQLEYQVDHLKNEVAGQVKIRLLVEQHMVVLQRTLQELEGLLEKVKKDYQASTQSTASLEFEVKRRQLTWEEKEKKHAEEMDVLLSSRGALEKRAIEAEESLIQVDQEKTAAVDSLQCELRQLKDQLRLLSREKDKLASEAYLQASELSAGKARLEDEIALMQEKLRESERQVTAMTNQYHNKMQELFLDKDVLEEKELLIAKEVKEMVMQVEEYREKESVYRSKLDELESKVAELEDDKQNLMNKNQELKIKASQFQQLKVEMDELRSSLSASTAAKSEVENLLNNLKSDHLRLQSQKSSLETKIFDMEKALREMEDLRNTKHELEERISQLQSELDEQETAKAFEAEQRIESMRLRRQNNEFKNKLMQQEVANEQFKHKMQLLERELHQKRNAVSTIEKKLQEKENTETGSVHEAVELISFRSKVKVLEDEIKYKTLEVGAMAEDFRKKELSLCQKIDHLEKVNQDLEQRKCDTDKIAELQNEVKRLQAQSEALSQQNQEKASKLQPMENSESEVLRLQKANEQLQKRVSQLIKEDSLERASIENELAEALKEINFYELQLQRELTKQLSASQATSTMTEASELKERISRLEEELKEMHNRYLSLSLKCAEVEAEREELFMTLKNIRNAKKS